MRVVVDVAVDVDVDDVVVECVEGGGKPEQTQSICTLYKGNTTDTGNKSTESNEEERTLNKRTAETSNEQTRIWF